VLQSDNLDGLDSAETMNQDDVEISKRKRSVRAEYANSSAFMRFLVSGPAQQRLTSGRGDLHDAIRNRMRYRNAVASISTQPKVIKSHGLDPRQGDSCLWLNQSAQRLRFKTNKFAANLASLVVYCF
jgi:hypothetical protein